MSDRKHITVHGVPWCECNKLHQFSYEYKRSLETEAYRKGVQLICMPNPLRIEEAVDFLRQHGVMAEIADGACPTLKLDDPEDNGKDWSTEG